MSKKIYLIDGNAFIYRMFFALPEFSTKDGRIVNATFGMAKFFVNQLKKEKPDYLVFIKDAKGDNFRHDLYADYKATRDRMPDNLRGQIKDIEEMLIKMGIDIIEIPGYEADDVIGTLATSLGEDKENDVFILSGDKDLYSLIADNVKVYDPQKKKVYGKKECLDKFGVNADKVIDYLAIVGDKADNIPGIDGFGPKKAVDLINNIGGVEEIYKEVEKVESGEKVFNSFEKSVQSCFKGKTFDKLINSKEDAFLSKKLATIALDVKLNNFSLEKYDFSKVNLLNKDVIDYFRLLEFNSLIGEEQAELKTIKDINLNVKIIGNKEGLIELEKNIKRYDKIILDTETTSLDVNGASLVGISILLDNDNIYYVNRLHDGSRVSDLELCNFLKNIQNSDLLIIGHNLKYDLEIIDLFLRQENINENNQEKSNGQISLAL